MFLWNKGRVQNKKNVSIRALPELAKPHPPIRATLPTLSAVVTIDETFSFSKKSAQKKSGKGKPLPPIRAMPELKIFSSFDVFPYLGGLGKSVYHITMRVFGRERENVHEMWKPFLAQLPNKWPSLKTQSAGLYCAIWKNCCCRKKYTDKYKCKEEKYKYKDNYKYKGEK